MCTVMPHFHRAIAMVIATLLSIGLYYCLWGCFHWAKTIVLYSLLSDVAIAIANHFHSVEMAIKGTAPLLLTMEMWWLGADKASCKIINVQGAN